MPFFALLALVTAISTVAASEKNRRDQEYQAAVAKQNALAKQQQAVLTRKQTEIAKEAADRDKLKTKRAYIEAAGTNMSLLTNVDPSSGSALGILEGNLNRYADDMGELEYEKDLDVWSGKRQAQLQDFGADVGFNQASFLSRTAGSLGESLITGAGAGAASYFASKALVGSSIATTGSKVTGKVSKVNQGFNTLNVRNIA